MQLRPGAIAFTITLACLSGLLPLSTDMYLPALPTIARVFGVGAAEAQMTLSVFLLGMVVGQIFHGPWSDSLGRKPVLLGGVALFSIASLICAIAPSIEILLLGRFLQAAGAAAPVIIARAIIRDAYDGAIAGRELSRVATFAGFAPMSAPVIGGALEQFFGWRAIFVACALIGIAIGALCWRALPETNARKQGWPSLRAIGGEYRAVLRSPASRAYLGLQMASQAGLFAFLSTGAFVLQNRYGMSPILFGAGFGVVALGFISGAYVAQRFVAERGIDAVIGAGVIVAASAGLIGVALMALDVPSSFVVLGPATLYVFGHGLTQPLSQTGVALPHPTRAGAAASLAGVAQLGFSAIYGFALASFLDATPLVLPGGMAAAGLSAVVIFALTRQARANKI